MMVLCFPPLTVTPRFGYKHMLRLNTDRSLTKEKVSDLGEKGRTLPPDTQHGHPSHDVVFKIESVVKNLVKWSIGQVN